MSKKISYFTHNCKRLESVYQKAKDNKTTHKYGKLKQQYNKKIFGKINVRNTEIGCKLY